MRELNADGSDPVEIAKAQKLDKKLTDIAKEHLGIQTLEMRNSDSLDFHSVGAGCVKSALKAAYEAGKKDWMS